MPSLRSARKVQRRGDEDGSSLLLALLFLAAISVIVLALVSFAENSLADSAKFNTATNVQYSTGAAAQLEIQNLRFSYQATNATATNCTPGNASPVASTATFTLNAVKVSVFCTYVSTPTIAQSRVITMYACEEDGASYVGAAACVAHPFLQTQVSFNDYTITDKNQCTSNANQISCGTSMNVAYWLIV